MYICTYNIHSISYLPCAYHLYSVQYTVLVHITHRIRVKLFVMIKLKLSPKTMFIHFYNLLRISINYVSTTNIGSKQIPHNHIDIWIFGAC